MRMIAIFGAALLHLLAALIVVGQPAAPAKKPPAQKCVPDGRYWFHLDKGQKVYCYDGDGFSEDKAPPHVKTFFETNGSSDGSVSLDGPIANPTMVDPSLPQPLGGGGGGSSAGPLPIGPVSGSGGGGGGGGGGGRSQIKDWGQMGGSAASVYAQRRDPDPLDPEKFEAIQTGMSRSQVTAKLGKAHGRIMNSGDEGIQEIWTYTARGNTTGSVRFRDGKVIAIRKP